MQRPRPSPQGRRKQASHIWNGRSVALCQGPGVGVGVEPSGAGMAMHTVGLPATSPLRARPCDSSSRPCLPGVTGRQEEEAHRGASQPSQGPSPTGVSLGWVQIPPFKPAAGGPEHFPSPGTGPCSSLLERLGGFSLRRASPVQRISPDPEQGRVMPGSEGPRRGGGGVVHSPT